MTRRRRRVPRETPNRWFTVRVGVQCSFGHQIAAGELAYFGPAREGRRPAICAEHMRTRYNMTPPDRPWVFKSAAPQDVKNRQVGEDE